MFQNGHTLLEGSDNTVEKGEKIEYALVKMERIFCSTFSVASEIFGSQPKLLNFGNLCKYVSEIFGSKRLPSSLEK